MKAAHGTSGVAQARKAQAWRARHRAVKVLYDSLLADPSMTGVGRILTMRARFGQHWELYLHPERTPEVIEEVLAAKAREDDHATFLKELTYEMADEGSDAYYYVASQ